MISLQKLCGSAILGIPDVDQLCSPTSKCSLSADLCSLNVAFLTRQFLLVGSDLDDVTAGYDRSSACCSLRGTFRHTGK